VRKSRRQIVNRIAEAAGLGLVVLSLVMFFAVYRPLGNKIDAAVRVHTELRQTIRNQQVRVDILKRFEAELPQAGTGIEAFEADRTPARREAYSTADHLVHKMADAAGVKLSTIAFHLDVGRSDVPLQRLGLVIESEGPYSKLLKFAYALETANAFLLVREFNLTRPGENEGVGLRLGADLYLKP
jgi:hypothetical protein